MLINKIIIIKKMKMDHLTMKVTKDFLISYFKLLKSMNRNLKKWKIKNNLMNKLVSIFISSVSGIVRLVSLIFIPIFKVRRFRLRRCVNVDVVGLKANPFLYVLMNFNIIFLAPQSLYFSLCEKWSCCSFSLLSHTEYMQ